MAREMAILGDYDTSLNEFKRIFENIHIYSKKYDSENDRGSGYSAKHGKQPQIATQPDYYL